MLRQGEGRRGRSRERKRGFASIIICRMSSATLQQQQKYSKFRVSSTPSPHNLVPISALFAWLDPDSQGVTPRARLASGHPDTAVNV